MRRPRKTRLKGNVKKQAPVSAKINASVVNKRPAIKAGYGIAESKELMLFQTRRYRHG